VINATAADARCADRAFNACRAPECTAQLWRYYDRGLAVRLVVARMISAHAHFLVCLQHPAAKYGCSRRRAPTPAPLNAGAPGHRH